MLPNPMNILSTPIESPRILRLDKLNKLKKEYAEGGQKKGNGEKGSAMEGRGWAMKGKGGTMEGRWKKQEEKQENGGK